MKCYLCESESTSVEHCPAKSFFPATKRLNLITVPSCSIHNEQTSLDDEYVRNLILITKGNNDVAEDLFKDKGLRSFQRSFGLFKELTKNPKRLNFIKGDEQSKNLSFQVDRNRFDKVMRKIAYGLYYFTFKETWKYELSVATTNLITDELEADPLAEKIKSANKELKSTINFIGSNPDVFKYSFLQFTYNNHKLLTMKFYDYFEVWVVPQQSSSQPSLD